MRTMLILDQASVRVYRIEISIENGVSSTRKVEYANIGGMLRNVEDLKFADDSELVIAGYSKCEMDLEFRSIVSINAD